MTTRSSLNLDKLRAMAGHPAHDNFFRGLVSSRLGSDRILDDELVDLIVGNQLLDDILDDLCNTPAGWAKINKAIEESFPEPIGPREADSDGAYERVCRLIWVAAVDDPRFNIVLKQALDDAKQPPPIVRGSGLSGVLGILDKIRAALTSGASKHSDATLAGSVLAALLAGALVPRAISDPAASAAPTTAATAQTANGSPTGVNSGVLHQLTTAVNSLNGNFAAQTSAVIALRESVLNQTEALNKLPQTYETLITNWQKQNFPDSSLTLNNSLTALENDVTQVKTVLASTNRDVKALQGQVDFAAKVKGTLDQIAYGIGPADQTASNPLPSLRKSSRGIADSLWASPQVASDSAFPSISKPLGSQATSATPPATAPTPTNGVSIAASLQTLAGIAKTEDNVYIRGLPIQSFVSKADSTEIFERATDGAPCTIRWHLESRAAENVTLSLFDKDCQTNPPQNPYKLVVDYKGKQVQGTKSEVSLDRIERTKWWSLFDKSAVLALYRK